MDYCWRNEDEHAPTLAQHSGGVKRIIWDDVG